MSTPSTPCEYSAYHKGFKDRSAVQSVHSAAVVRMRADQIRTAMVCRGVRHCGATLYAVPRVSTVALSQAFETRWAAGTVIGWEEEKVPKTAPPSSLTT